MTEIEYIETIILQLPNFAGLVIAILVLHRELRHANDLADRYYSDLFDLMTDDNKDE